MCFLLAWGAAAQSGAPVSSFEAASVKRATGQPGGGMKGGPGTADPGQITWTNVTMRTVLLRAYGVKAYQLAAPKWVDTERYEIAAKIPKDSTEERFGAMLRELVKERFQMAAHEEIRESPIYALVAGKNGSKLKEASAANAVPETTPAEQPAPGQRLRMGSDGFPMLAAGPGMFAIILNGSVRLTAQAQSIARLAELLSSRYLDRDVVDLTGLKGLYDFHLTFTPDSVLAALPPGPDGARPETMSTDVFASLGEQLGLKLESRKGPVKIVVIDSLEKAPIEN
jgi:uncharacterized protein (TIGR03435 family)